MVIKHIHSLNHTLGTDGKMDEEKLIEFVRLYTCLWDSYKDIKAKENA